MSRGRRQVIQLDEPARIFYSNEPVHENEEDDEDSYGEMPTPERLVTDDMMQCQPPPPASVPVSSAGMEIDNKVANFLAEIDALDPGGDAESSRSPAPPRTQDMSPPRDSYSPTRERSPPRNKPNAYSNMFVKGASEFVRKPEDTEGSGHSKKIEPWPEEPKSDWQQLTDEKTTYPYYWNTVTNEVVWDMPAEFSQFLLRHKEYEEKVEKGLREGTLDPAQRGKSTTTSAQEDGDAQKLGVRDSVKQSKSASRHARRSSRSEDSSSDSSDSDNSRSRDSPRRSRKGRLEKHEVSSSSAENSRAASHDKLQRSATPDLPDSTRSEDKRVSTSKQSSKEADNMDFDIDDIDKELEMALERKRQELMKAEGKKEETDEGKSGDRKKDEHRHRDDEKKDERHRKHGHHRDYERSRDSDRRHEREEKKPKLTLKERLRIEMELKMEKERRRKRAIEEMMARELEQTVGSSSRHKRHRDDREKSHKRYRHDDDEYRPVHDDYRDYGRGYDDWRGASLYDDRFLPPMKPPPPTAEMIAYEEERKSQVVDYGHGRSHSYDINGDSDTEESRSADVREMEVKKLEALQLAELALSKLEFLEVTKKGLSKLQILLIELETRHQDWQAGGLTTNHFLNKLSEANWQLEQYEASAAPAGWVCSWDRYEQFYTRS